MTNPLRELRSIINKERTISSGIVLDIFDDNALVSTSEGVFKISVSSGGIFKVGDSVTIQDNVIQSIDRGISDLPYFEV